MPHPSSLQHRTVAAATAFAACLSLAACGGETAAQRPEVPSKVAGVNIDTDRKLHRALPEEIRESGVVRVATDVPYPPFEMFTEAGSKQLTGLDYDLGQAIGARLGVKFTFTPQKFDGIIPAIQAGKFEVAMSAITDNEERQQVVDFVDYSLSGTGIMVREGNPERLSTLDDLCGRKVAAQVATNQLDLLTAHSKKCEADGAPAISVQTYPKDSDAQLALRSGKVVAHVLTKPAAAWTAKTADGGKTFDLVEDPEAPGGYRASPNGIAVSKRMPELTDAIRRALQSLIDDGTAEKVFDKYGLASIALGEATENAGAR